ncbi:MAG: oligosaccharide flippase family protein [Bacillota bacterium]
MRKADSPLLSMTATLTVTAILSRIWGFAMRAIMARLIGAEGMGLFQVTGAYFMGFVIPITSGLSPATSRLVARGSDGRRTHFTDRVVAVAASMGLAASTVSLFLARVIRPRSPEACEALSPGAMGLMITSSTIYAVIEGFFIGSRNVGALVIADQIMEAVRFALATFTLVQFSAFSIGLRLRWIMVVTAFAETLSLAWLVRRYVAIEVVQSRIAPEPMGKVAGEIVRTALPVGLTRLTGSAMRMVEVSFAPHVLSRTGLSVRDSLAAYGQVTGMAIPVVLIPAVITTSLAISMIPEVAKCGTVRQARNKAWKASAVSLVFGLWVAWLIRGYAGAIARTLYGPVCDARVLASIAFLAPALYVDQVTSAALRGMGRANAALISDVAAWILRLWLILSLPAHPGIGIHGFTIAIVASSALSAALNMVALLLAEYYPSER